MGASSTRSERVPRHEAWAPLACAVVAALLAGLLVVDVPDFALDDAYIHLAYAKSLRLGEGLSYNPHDWETGFSSPLWVLLLSVWPVPRGPGTDPVISVKLLGVLMHAVTAWAAASLVMDLARDRARDDRPVPLLSITLLGGVLVAATPPLLQGAASGMEVPLAAAALAWGTRTAVAGSVRGSLALGLAAVWSRPECLIYAVALALPLCLWRWRAASPRPRVIAPAALAGGALLGLGVWMAYDLAVSGWVWPNPQYIKGEGGGLAGLHYLLEEVLVWQVWLVSLTGAVLLGLGLSRDLVERRPEMLAIVVATAATMAGIAVTRPLHEGVQFFESRYFAIVAGMPMALLPVALANLTGRGRWLGAALLLPVVVISGLQTSQVYQALMAGGDDTRTLHTRLARTIATQLPSDAVVAVEGAGAPRFFTPRSMTIIDLVGLNDRIAAHLHHQPEAKVCHYVRQDPTHIALPQDWIPIYGSVFELTPLARFTDDAYTQVRPPRELTVVLFEIRGVAAAWAERCGKESDRRPG